MEGKDLVQNCTIRLKIMWGESEKVHGDGSEVVMWS